MIEAIHRLLPASASIIRDVGAMTADNVFRALDQQQVAYRIMRLGSNDWEIDASELTDDEIFARLHMDEAGHNGQLFICTEACSRYGLDPFRCDATELAGFVSEYSIDNLFDGDVIIICEESRTITVYHHAGGYTHVILGTKKGHH